MVAIAVSGALLGAAYYTVSHAMANNLASQEHTVALGIAQSQVERIASLEAPTTDPAVVKQIYSNANTNIHCFDTTANSGGTTNVFDFPIGGTNGVTTLSVTTPLTSFPDQCKDIAGIYRAGFQYFPNASDVTKSYFKVLVFWPNPSGGTDSSVTFTYQLPDPSMP